MEDNWPVLALAALTAIFVTITVIVDQWSGAELLWGWLELLIIPASLLLGAFWLNTKTRKSEQEIARRERKNDRQIAEDRAREEALQRYLDRMSELVLDKNLRGSKQDDAVQAMARARTLTVLRGLDGTRKGQVVRFLHEADLIGKAVRDQSADTQVVEVVIYLNTADLSGADLRGANLIFADLIFAKLNSAKLGGANLNGAKLGGANLNLTDLRGPDLRGADLSGAKEWTKEQLAQAAFLAGAILRDRTVMTEEAEEEFKKRHRQWWWPG